MKMIRTTLTLPVSLHEVLRHQAVSENVSFSELIVRQLMNIKPEIPEQREQRMKQMLESMTSLRGSIVPTKKILIEQIHNGFEEYLAEQEKK